MGFPFFLNVKCKEFAWLAACVARGSSESLIWRKSSSRLQNITSFWSELEMQEWQKQGQQVDLVAMRNEMAHAES